MEINVGKKGTLGEQPHFYHVHDKHFRKERKPSCYELPLQEVRAYIAEQLPPLIKDKPVGQSVLGWARQHPTEPHAILCEALARLFGSHGVRIEFDQISSENENVGQCFTIDRDPDDPYSPVHLDENFVELNLTVAAILLGNTYGHTRTDHPQEIKAIRTHLTAALAAAGLEPNMDRLRKEFRPDNRVAIEGGLL